MVHRLRLFDLQVILFSHFNQTLNKMTSSIQAGSPQSTIRQVSLGAIYKLKFCASSSRGSTCRAKIPHRRGRVTRRKWRRFLPSCKANHGESLNSTAAQAAWYSFLLRLSLCRSLSQAYIFTAALFVHLILTEVLATACWHRCESDTSF